MALMNDTFIEYGFSQYSQGGGCMAWRKNVENGGYWLITSDDGCDLPNEDDVMIMVGWYNDDEDEGSCDLVSFKEFHDHFMP